MITPALMKSFDDCIQKNCSHAYINYNAALSENEIEEYLLKIGFGEDDLKEDFKTIYQWKNGIDAEAQDYSIDLRIVFQGNFISLKDILQLYEENKEEEYGWRPLTLIPIITNYEGEFLLIESDKTSTKFGKVCFYSPNLLYASDPIIIFDNLESMIKTIIRLFESGAQQFNKVEKILEFDFDRIYQIIGELNRDTELTED